MIKKIIGVYNDRNSVSASGVTNHLNMGLFALYKMGAGEDLLNWFAKYYIKKENIIEVPKSDLIITEENYDKHLGQVGSYSAFVIFYKSVFEKETPKKETLKDESFENVLKKYVNKLVLGSAGDTFQGLIRLAYAYELEAYDEIINALAYCSECYLKFENTEVTEVTNPANLETPFDSILKLSKSEYFINRTYNSSVAIERMIAVREDVEYKNIVSALPESHQNSKAMNSLMLKLYAHTQNITMLHCYTSTHALRVLEPILINYKKVLQLHWLNVQLAYISTSCTPILEVPSYDVIPKWPFIFRAALAKVDVNAIEMAYSTYEQCKLFGEDELSRIVASLKLYKSN